MGILLGVPDGARLGVDVGPVLGILDGESDGPEGA